MLNFKFDGPKPVKWRSSASSATLSPTRKSSHLSSAWKYFKENAFLQIGFSFVQRSRKQQLQRCFAYNIKLDCTGTCSRSTRKRHQMRRQRVEELLRHSEDGDEWKSFTLFTWNEIISSKLDLETLD